MAPGPAGSSGRKGSRAAPVDLATWASANRLQRWVTNALVAGTLPGRIFRKVKQAAQAAGSGKLSESLRKELMAFIRTEEPNPTQPIGKKGPATQNTSRPRTYAEAAAGALDPKRLVAQVAA